MSVLSRRAGRRDLEAIQARWLELRESEAKSDARLAPSKNAAQITAEHREVILADRRTAFFVAEDWGDIVGYLHAQIEQDDPAYDTGSYGLIADLFVDLDRRNQGIGSALLRCAAEWFGSHGMREYRVRTPVSHPEARAFFERAGATELRTTLSAPVS
jgi:GNAT superfamily N-acetyltransferase